MSGNSKQRKQELKRTRRFLDNFRGIMHEQIGPMIREDRQTEFAEVLKGLDELIDEVNQPRKQAPDLKGF